MLDGLATTKKMKKGKEAAAEIVGILFMSRTYAHMAHLKTGDYAKHVALNGFYDAVVDLADSFAEVSQGKFGKLDVPFLAIEGDVDKPIEALESHMEDIVALGSTCGSGAIKNIVDEIEACYLQTLYKLRELL